MRNLILSNKAQRNIVILFIKKIDKFQFIVPFDINYITIKMNSHSFSLI